MDGTSWHYSAIDRLCGLLEADESVVGLYLTGSFGQPDGQPDEWSDVDMTVVVKDEARDRLCSDLDWLRVVGSPYAVAVSGTSAAHSRRVYLTNGKRVDVTVVQESDLDSLDSAAYGARLLFSRSDALDRSLANQPAPLPPKPFSPNRFEQMSEDFWFKAMLSAHKVARDELLVALHLSLDLIRDCAVLCMLLRDRDLGTDHHRWGAAGLPFVDELTATARPYTAEGILDSIKESAVLFDSLAARLFDGYRPRRMPLVRWVSHVRRRKLTPGKQPSR